MRVNAFVSAFLCHKLLIEAKKGAFDDDGTIGYVIAKLSVK